MSRFRIFAVLFACLTGFLFGQISIDRSSVASRFPSSEEDLAEKAYEKLPCPSNEQFKKMMAELKMKNPPDTYVCDNSEFGKLGKLLLFTRSLNFQPDENWKKTLVFELVKPLEYINRMNLQFELNTTEIHAIASNSSGNVSLGPRFFKDDPIGSVNTLIHESRHSDKRDAGHVACQYGDLPTVEGGCDAEFSSSPEKAGAYSYGIYFDVALALFSDQITESQKELLKSEALVQLANRFNAVPESLAALYDLVAVLTEEQQLKIIHPFTGELIPIDPKPEDNLGKTSRIELDTGNNGLLLFTEDFKIHQMDLKGKSRRYQKKAIPEQMELKETARMRILYENYPYATVVTRDNELHYISFNPAKNTSVLNKVDLTKYPMRIEISRILLGFFDEAFYISEDGRLYRAKRWGDEREFFIFDEKLQPPGLNWAAGTSGVTYADLFLLSDKGEFYRGRYENILPPGNDVEVKTYSTEKLPTHHTGPLKKYIEGINFKTYLTLDGHLQLARYGTDRAQPLLSGQAPSAIRDFVIVRHAELSRSLLKPETRLEEFKNACNLTTVKVDPWMRKGIGIDADGRLIFEGSESERCILWQGQKPGMRFSDLSFKSQPAAEPRRFSHSYIELTAQDGVQKLELYGYLR